MRRVVAFCILVLSSLSLSYAQDRTSSGKGQAGGEVQVIFACSFESPGMAYSMVETILRNYVQNGIEGGGYALSDHSQFCFAKSGKVSNPDYLRQASAIGRRDGIVYYAIRFNDETAVGAIARAR